MKKYGICKLPLIPVRKDPSKRSEMISQVLYGETFEITEIKGTWSHIKTHFDCYEGWITTKMFLPLNTEELKKYQQAKHVILKQPVNYISIEDQLFYLPGGSVIPVEKMKSLTSTEIFMAGFRPKIPETALTFLNAPYLWGGRTIMGIDCSGLTQIVLKINGISIPRDAYLQAETGIVVPSVEEALSGDLAFFHDEEGNIHHTGIILGNSQIIHASGHVHIDLIDNTGIFSKSLNIYTHKLTSIKRFTQLNPPK